MTGVPVVLLLLLLAPRDLHLVGIDDDDVVTHVEVGRVGRLVLAAQDTRYLGGQTAKNPVGGVDYEPLAIDFAFFRQIGFHKMNRVFDKNLNCMPVGLKPTRLDALKFLGTQRIWEAKTILRLVSVTTRKL